MPLPTLMDIQSAAARIGPYTHRTPVMTSSALDAMCGARLYFKCENLQKVGAFKIRGAANAVLSLSDGEATKGVATHSSGNHAAALALAARWRGVPAFVVMPEGAPEVKRAAVKGYGATIFGCAPTLAAREARLIEVVAETGAAVVHPYNDYRVIAGQGTAALELCEEVPNLDMVVAPVGGGGLLSGTALLVNALRPHVQVIGAEPARADDAWQSMQAGRIVTVEHPDTIADGLRASLGDLTFPIIQRYVAQIVRVSEDAIVDATRKVWERMKLVVEPSGAVPLAAVLSGEMNVRGLRIGIILSGGNVDLDHPPWIR